MDLDWNEAFESGVRTARCEMPFVLNMLRYGTAWLTNQALTFEAETFIRPEAAGFSSRRGELDE